jgi:hypothetical protein
MPPPPAESSSPSAVAGIAEQVSWLERLQRGLDRLLVLDVFLVLAGALWFGLGVVLHLRGIDRVLEVFQRLWMPLFQPALGLLMLAALFSGALGWWRRRGQR